MQPYQLYSIIFPVPNIGDYLFNADDDLSEAIGNMLLIAPTCNYNWQHAATNAAIGTVEDDVEELVEALLLILDMLTGYGASTVGEVIGACNVLREKVVQYENSASFHKERSIVRGIAIDQDTLMIEVVVVPYG